MRTLITVIVLLGAGAALLAFPVPRVADAVPAAYTIDQAVRPQVTARAWGIYDTETGEELIAHQPHERLPIASVTKLMTAAVVLESGPPAATTTLSARAVATEGRAGRLRAGEVLPVYELLFPLLIESSNDAAEALAEYRGREAFIASMNLAAARIGMLDTAYVDPSGLSPENISSVADLARLAAHLADAAPHLLDITQLSQYVAAAHTWVNNSPVARAETFRGGKHGYTDEANRTFVGMFAETFPRDTSRTLTLVLLGSDDLPVDIAALRTFVETAVRYE